MNLRQIHSINKTMLEDSIKSATNIYYSRHEFNYIGETPDIFTKVEVELQKSEEEFDEYAFKDIAFLDRLNLPHKVTYTNLGNLHMYSRGKLDYLDSNIIGYSKFDKENKIARHYIIDFKLFYDDSKKRTFWDKIKPLEYEVNPIGSFKVELMFWIAFMSLLNYISGSTLILKQHHDNIYHIPYFVCFFISLIMWARLSTLVSIYFKEKRVIK